MPIPIKYTCPRCKGETDIPNRLYLPCEFSQFVEQKRIPSHYFAKPERRT